MIAVLYSIYPIQYNDISLPMSYNRCFAQPYYNKVVDRDQNRPRRIHIMAYPPYLCLEP